MFPFEWLRRSSSNSVVNQSLIILQDYLKFLQQNHSERARHNYLRISKFTWLYPSNLKLDLISTISHLLAHPRTQPTTREDEIVEFKGQKFMSQPQTIISQQPDLTPVSIDPNPLLEDGNSPTAIILAISTLLWVLRPVMLKQKSGSSKK